MSRINSLVPASVFFVALAASLTACSFYKVEPVTRSSSEACAKNVAVLDASLECRDLAQYEFEVRRFSDAYPNSYQGMKQLREHCVSWEGGETCFAIEEALYSSRSAKANDPEGDKNSSAYNIVEYRVTLGRSLVNQVSELSLQDALSRAKESCMKRLEREGL